MTTYRTTPEEGYSLDELTPEGLNACGLLAWEMLRRDRQAPADDIEALFAAAEVGEVFQQRLGAVVRSFEATVASEQKTPSGGRWDELVTEHIDGLSDPRQREVIFSFLFDLATIATINPAEAALLDRLRGAWKIVDR